MGYVALEGESESDFRVFTEFGSVLGVRLGN